MIDEKFEIDKADEFYITGIAGKRGYTVIDVKYQNLAMNVGIYRAVLAYNKEEDSYIGIAAYFENKKNAYVDFTKTLPDTILMSVDALEEKLGMDFFVNLPAVVGESKANAIEAENPANNKFWWQ